MGIAERIARITAGKSSDFGARPSKEQEAASDRLHKGMHAARDKKRKTLSMKKKEAREKGTIFRHNPPSVAASHGTRSSLMSCSREDVLAAMRGLGPTSTAYILFQYAQDRTIKNSKNLLKGVDYMALDLHDKNGWKVHADDKGKKKEIIRCMCRAALFELTDPKCMKCFGAKCGRNGGACKRCQGTGKMRITDRDRAAALRVKYDAFRKTYRHRYFAVMNMISALGPNALRKMHHNLYGAAPSIKHEDCVI